MTSFRRDRLDAVKEQSVVLGSSPPDFLDFSLEWRRLFAETWGTFLPVVVAAGGGVVAAKRVFEKSRFCHISATMFSHSGFQTAGANPGPRTVSLDLPGLFKHPLRAKAAFTPVAQVNPAVDNNPPRGP
jgi:hypothetical protein